MTPRSSATTAGFAAILFWSTTVAFARSMAEQVGPLTSGALAYLISGTAGCGYLAARGRLRAKFTTLDRRYLLGCGALFVFYEFCLFLAVGLAADRSQSLEVGLINYLWPTLTLAFSVPLLRMRARVWLVPGVLVATFGVFLVTTQNRTVTWQTFYLNLTQNRAPYLLALGAAVSWALYSNLSRKWAGQAESGAVSVFMLATGLTLAGARLFVDEPANWNGRVVLEILYMATAPNIAYVLWDLAMRKGDMVLVAAGSYFTPFLSTVVSCLYLAVAAGMKLWIGCALIVAGAIVCKVSLRDDRAAA
ncbi:MAG: aromatic amino acid DMT transporter YddG [Kiritimatiellae bacterium]|nr:aromatic amino acid DMT transporter YddG [Kiritimatiellia bacterium]